MKVHELMTEGVVTVGVTTPVKDLARLMAKHKISGLPVIDRDGHVLGVVSEGDLIVKEERCRGTNGCGDPQRQRQRIDGTVAGALMSTPAVVVDRNDDLRVAARRLSEHGVKRLPVTAQGRLCGIITRKDVLRAFLRPDDEIREEIEQLIERMILDTDHDIHVGVAEGVVTMRGTVGRRSTANLIRHYVDRVDGVTKVCDGLLWGIDDVVAPVVPPPLGVLEYQL